MYKQVDAYYTSCFIRQEARVIHGKGPGKLQPLLIPITAWDVFSMDFIAGLPESIEYKGTYDVILVVIDKLSKMCHYIPCCSDMTAGQLVEVITQEVIQLHGVPSAIISSRGSLFIFLLWANFIYSFRIEWRLSTDFTLKPTDKQRDRTPFLNNFYAVMSTTSRMTGRPF